MKRDPGNSRRFANAAAAEIVIIDLKTGTEKQRFILIVRRLFFVVSFVFLF